MSDIKLHRFANGLQLVYQNSIQKNLTSIHIFCNVGSAYEVDGIRGASHLVEHMCFKGTDKIANARTLLKQYNEVGAYFNAYTEKRYTAYVIKCDNENTETCLLQIAEMLLHSVFSKKEFAKEQHVVVEENIRIKDDNQYILEKTLDKYYFTGSSYKNPIDSFEYHPSDITLKYNDVYDLYKTFYHPSNMVCSIVSSLSFSAIASIFKKSEFTANLPKHPHPIGLSYPILNLEIPKKSTIVFMKKKGISATIINVGFRTCPHSSKDKYAIRVLKHILNGFSGRLFTAFRTKHGLTYHSSCVTTYHEHTGYMMIKIQTDPKKIQQVLHILFTLLIDLQKNGVNVDELRSAKGNIKGSILRQLESIQFISEYNGIEAILNDNIVSCEDIYEQFIKGVTKVSIDRIIKKYIYKENMVMGVMYDNSLPKNLDKIINILH